MVNQASITGEGLAVCRTAGSYVYAGTVVEEGECTIRVDKRHGLGTLRPHRPYDRGTESSSPTPRRRPRIWRTGSCRTVSARRGLIWLLTRNVNRALAVLMVDFRARSASMPIAVLSGMKEAEIHHISVKGGRFMGGGGAGGHHRL